MKSKELGTSLTEGIHAKNDLLTGGMSLRVTRECRKENHLVLVSLPLSPHR
jgi:hypothetical protein